MGLYMCRNGAWEIDLLYKWYDSAPPPAQFLHSAACSTIINAVNIRRCSQEVNWWSDRIIIFILASAIGVHQFESTSILHAIDSSNDSVRSNMLHLVGPEYSLRDGANVHEYRQPERGSVQPKSWQYRVYLWCMCKDSWHAADWGIAWSTCRVRECD